MKKIFVTIIILPLFISLKAQNFAIEMASAKSAYKSGNLEDTHFALQQMLQELDITIGKEVLKMLPQKMDTLNANTQNDRVSGNIGFVGATIQRNYGVNNRTTIEIVNNSPMLGALNAMLSSPLMAMGSDGKTKVIKVQGYKSRITMEDNNGFRLEIPLSNAMITLTASNTSEAGLMAMANAIPLDNVSKLIQ